MAKRSAEKLLTPLESNEVVEIKDIQSALDHASRATWSRSSAQSVTTANPARSMCSRRWTRQSAHLPAGKR